MTSSDDVQQCFIKTPNILMIFSYYCTILGWLWLTRLELLVANRLWIRRKILIFFPAFSETNAIASLKSPRTLLYSSGSLYFIITHSFITLMPITRGSTYRASASIFLPLLGMFLKMTIFGTKVVVAHITKNRIILSLLTASSTGWRHIH